MTRDIYYCREGYYAVSEDGEPSEYYPTKPAPRRAVDDGTAWGFTLQQVPAGRPARTSFASTPTRQRVLLTGLDLLPDQQDLIPDLDGSR